MKILTQFARPIYGGIGCILCLHRVIPEDDRSPFPGNRALEITPGALRAMLAWVHRRGLDPVRMDDVPARLGARKPRKFIAFSFNVGYRDNLIHALPIFREFEMPFTVHVTTGFVSGTHIPWWYALEPLLTGCGKIEFEWDGEQRAFFIDAPSARERTLADLGAMLRALGPGRREKLLARVCAACGVDPAARVEGLMLSPKELLSLSEDRLVTIGAHTVGHYDLSALTAEEARAEMADSKRELETWLHREVRHFAYPFGGAKAAGSREFGIARECDFLTAVTTRNANLFPEHGGHLHALPRLGLSGNYPILPRLRKLESGLITAKEYAGRRVIVE